MPDSLIRTPDKSILAMLWDDSHLWGLMLRRALVHFGIPHKIVHSRDIAAGDLDRLRPGALLVPGGWARRKSASLGERGRHAIKAYVAQGGTYLGFCGGAGLALDDPASDHCGLGLCPWGRKPMSRRLVNCSGHVHLRLNGSFAPPAAHTPDTVLAPVWWPSQFEPTAHGNIDVLASYGYPAEDFWVADLPMQQLAGQGLSKWEELYGINLDPVFLQDEPCVISGAYGTGRYLLSYAHLETPDSPQANAWLFELLAGMAGHPCGHEDPSIPEWDLTGVPVVWDHPVLRHLWENLTAVLEVGQQNFLFSRRKGWLLGWRRGVPGFALNTLLALTGQCMSLEPTKGSEKWLRMHAAQLRGLAELVHELFTAYLAGERFHLSHKGEPYAAGPSQGLQRKKLALVGDFPGQEGLLGEMTGLLNELLWLQLGNDLD